MEKAIAIASIQRIIRELCRWVRERRQARQAQILGTSQRSETRLTLRSGRIARSESEFRKSRGDLDKMAVTHEHNTTYGFRRRGHE
jgi:hypothetical protein